MKSATTLNQRLKALYAAQDVLPKLIDDELIPIQKMDDYYVDLSISLNRPGVQASKKIDMGDIFKDINDQKASNQVLISGDAGMGKTTILCNIAYKWGKDQIFNDKFDFVFKVRLKILTSNTSIDTLSKLIQTALDIETQTANQNLENEKTKLEKIYEQEIKEVLEETGGKNKILLLLDGYDEVSFVATDKNSAAYRILQKIFKNEHSYIMTSRPGALDLGTLNKFGRIIDSGGFDDINVKAYINKHLAQHDEARAILLDIYENNSDISDAFKTPINLVMACVVFADSVNTEGGNKLLEDFGIVDLYDGFIIQLGKRYIQKKHPNVKLKHIDDEEVRELKELKVLKEGAYKKFQASEVILKGKEDINDIARTDSLRIGEVYDYGLLKIENSVIDNALLNKLKSRIIDEALLKELKNRAIDDALLKKLKNNAIDEVLLRELGNKIMDDNLLKHNYMFVHLSFQEYLAAWALKEKLVSSDPKESSEAANYVAMHRNEPRVLVMLKFLIGLVSREKGDNQGLVRLWDALVCNVDGVLEFGIDKKVALLMPLLNASKAGGEIDSRIPHLFQVQNLIDKTVLKDLTDWGKTLQTTGYLSDVIKARSFEILNADSANSEELILAIRLLSKHITRFKSEAVHIVAKIEFHLLHNEDWKVKDAAMQESAKIAPLLGKINMDVVNYVIMEFIAKGNVNLKDTSLEYVKQLSRIELKVIDMLINLQQTSKYYRVEEAASALLRDVVKLSPEAGLKAVDALINLIKTSPNDLALGAAIYALGEAAKSYPAAGLKAVDVLINMIKTSTNDRVLGKAASALGETAKSSPEVASKITDALINLIKTSPNDLALGAAIYALGEAAKLSPEAGLKATDALINLMKVSTNDRVLGKAASALGEAARSSPEAGLKAVDALINLMKASTNDHALGAAVSALGKAAKSSPEGGLKAVDALINLMKTSTNDHALGAAVSALGKAAKSSPEGGLKAVDALINLMKASTDEDVVCNAAFALSEATESSPAAGLKAVDALINLVKASTDEYVVCRTAFALSEAAKSSPEAGLKAVDALINLLKVVMNWWAEDYLPAHMLRAVVNAVSALGKAAKSSPEAASKITDALINLIKTSTNDLVLDAAISALGEAAKSSPEVGLKVTDAFINLMKTKMIKTVPTHMLYEIAKLSPATASVIIDLLIKRIETPTSDYGLSNAVLVMGRILEDINTILEVISIFNNNSKLIQDHAIIALIHKLSPKVINDSSTSQSTAAKKDIIDDITIEMIPDLLKILAQINGQTDPNKAKLSQLINQNLSKILVDHQKDADGVDQIVKFVMEKFDTINASFESKPFLTMIYHLILKEGKISALGKEFIIKVIERGFTTLFTHDSIIVEGKAYKLEADSQTQHHLKEIIATLLESDDPYIKQYKTHKPFFKRADNSGHGMSLSATNIVDVRKLVSAENFDYGSWQLSLMYLSDHLKSSCKDEFLLLEHRDAFGYHIVYKINDSGISRFAKHPDELSTQFAKNIFDEMVYSTDMKPRYYMITTSIGNTEAVEIVEEVASTTNIYELFNKYSATKVGANWDENVDHADLQELKANDLLRYDENKASLVRQKSMDIELAIVEDQLGKLDINALIEVGNEANLAAKDAEQLKEIKQDEYASAFYYALQWQLNGAYMACIVIDTKMVANQRKGMIGKIGGVLALKSVSSRVPVIGVGVGVLGSIMSGVDARLQEMKIDNFKEFAKGIDMAKFSEQVARALALKASTLKIHKDTGMVAKIGDKIEGVQGSIANIANKALTGIGEKVASHQIDNNKKEKVNQSVKYAKRFFKVEKEEGPAGEAEEKATEIAKFIIEQIFDDKANCKAAKTLDEKVTQVEKLIGDSQSVSINSLAATTAKGECCTILYSTLKYDNPLLNDYGLIDLLKIARANAYNINELIALGNDQTSYETFMSLRKDRGDATAIKIMLAPESSVLTLAIRETDNLHQSLSENIENAPNPQVTNYIFSGWINWFSGKVEKNIKQFIYRNEINRFKEVLKKNGIEKSVDVLQNPTELKKSVLLKLHPDKGGNNEDFTFVKDLEEKLTKVDVKKALNSKIQDIQSIIYKTSMTFKVLDTVTDAARLVYEPTTQNAGRVVLDSTYLYSMYSGINSYSAFIGGGNAIYQTYQGEYEEALKQVATTISYIVLPTLLAYTGIPYVGLAYGMSMMAYTGYSAITNAYSFYQDNSPESVLRSIIAYKDLTKTLSESPLQHIYDFTTMAKEYKLRINNIALTEEKKVIKAKLVEEKGEFGKKLYDYIYEPSLEEKYTLINQVLQGYMTEEQAEPLKAKHITIESHELSYEHCLEIKNTESNNETLEHYYCYNEEQQIVDHILIGGNNIQVIERL